MLPWPCLALSCLALARLHCLALLCICPYLLAKKSASTLDGVALFARKSASTLDVDALFAKKSASTFDVDALCGRKNVYIDTLFGRKIGLVEQNNKQNFSRIGLR